MKKKLLALAMAFTVCVMSLSAVFPVISFAATPEVDLSDKTLINYEGVPGVTVTQDGQVEIPAVTANNGMLSITGKRGDVGDFRSVFRLYLPQPSESIAKDQVVFCIIFRNQSTDQENWIGTTWPWYFDAYGLKIMPDGIQLMRGSNIIKLFSWTTLNLFDARQHVLALNCVNEGANVRITLDVDDSSVVNFLDDGSIKQDVFGNSLMDHTNIAVSNPTPLTGNGGFQIFAQNTSAILAKNDIVFEEVVPELTKVDITTGWSTSIAEGTGLVMAENEMSLPNGGTRPDTYDTWNYTLPTEKNLTNYTAKFKLTATPGDSSDPIFRLVVKNAGKMDDIVQMTWPLESYTLEFHKGDYRVLRGANIMHYAGGTTILDGKEHDCELTVYNNDKGGVTIIFSYDGVELIRYVDLGGQTTDFFNGQISGGPLAPVTAIGSMQIDTIDTSVLLKTEKVFDPSTLPKVDFTSSDVLNFAQVEAVTIEDGQVTLPNGASGNGRTEITGKTNDIGNFTTTFNVNLKPGAASSDQIVFGVTFRCKNSDLNTWIGATWPWYFDAYTLKKPLNNSR